MRFLVNYVIFVWHNVYDHILARSLTDRSINAVILQLRCGQLRAFCTHLCRNMYVLGCVSTKIYKVILIIQMVSRQSKQSEYTEYIHTKYTIRCRYSQ